MICEYYDMCAFIQKMNKLDPLTAGVVIKTYCEPDKVSCARYFLFQRLEVDRIPDYLWPSDDTEAMEVVEDNCRKSLSDRAKIQAH
jgi:hypothetical protein